MLECYEILFDFMKAKYFIVPLNTINTHLLVNMTIQSFIVFIKFVIQFNQTIDL